MSLFAWNVEVLRVFNDLLHDLYFTIPQPGFVARDNRVEVELWDRDHVIDKEQIYRFKLTVHNIVDLRNVGRLEDLPGYEAELNELRFEASKGELSFVCVHRYQLCCVVQGLKVELDQISATE